MYLYEATDGGEFDYGNAEFRGQLLEQGFRKLEGLIWQAGLEQPILDDALAQLAAYAPSEQLALAAAASIGDELGRVSVLAGVARQWEDDALKATVRDEVRPHLARRTSDDAERDLIWVLGLQVAVGMRDPGIIGLVGNEGDRERMLWVYAERTGDLDIIKEIGSNLGKHFPHYLDILAHVLIYTDSEIAPYVSELAIDGESDRRQLDEILLERLKVKKDGKLVESMVDPGFRIRALYWLATEKGGRQITDGLYGLYTAYWGNSRKHGDPENYVHILADYMNEVDAQAPLADLRSIADSEPEEEADPTKHLRAKIEALSVLAGIGDTAAAADLVAIMNIDTVPANERWRWHEHLANISIALKDPKWALMIRGNGDDRRRNKALLQIALETQAADVLDEALVVDGVEQRDELVRQYCVKRGDLQATQLILDPELCRQAKIDVAVQSGLVTIAEDLDEDAIWEAVSRLCERSADVLVGKELIAEMQNPEIQFRLYRNRYLKGDVDALFGMVETIAQAPDAEKFQMLADLSVYANALEYAYRAVHSFITHGPSTLMEMDEPERRAMVDYGIAMFRNIRQLSAAR